MSENGKLVKDLILFIVSGLIIARYLPDGEVTKPCTLLFVFCGFIPFGWRWASSVITATSLYGYIIKLMLAVILGMVAGPVTLIRDIMSVIYGITNRYKKCV